MDEDNGVGGGKGKGWGGNHVEKSDGGEKQL